MKRILTAIILTFFMSCGTKDYKVLNEDINANISRIEVRTDNKLPKTKIRKIALEIREDRVGYDKVWITFFVPERLPDRDAK